LVVTTSDGSPCGSFSYEKGKKKTNYVPFTAVVAPALCCVPELGMEGDSIPIWFQKFVAEGCPGLQNAELVALVGTVLPLDTPALGPALALPVAGGVVTGDLVAGEGGVLPLGTCNFSATSLARSVCFLDTSAKGSAYICKALIEPHSMSLLFSHCKDTGFVRKSLHPAPRAAIRSLCNDEAVKATIITEERYGLAILVSEEVSDGVEASVACLSPDGVCM
jgi:hypothetical protein